jgi:uncharacterized protein YkwD
MALRCFILGVAVLSGCADRSAPRMAGPRAGPSRPQATPGAALEGMSAVDDEHWLGMSASCPTFDARRVEKEILRRANEFRIQAGRTPLSHNPALSEAARSHSEEMARTGKLSHNSNDPKRETMKERVALQGLGFRALAENIALEPCAIRYWSNGRVDLYTWAEVAANAVEHWSRSPGHRANLLRREVRELGVGAAIAEKDGRPYVYITQNFRTP